MAIDSHVVSRHLHLHTWTSLTSWKEPFSWTAQTHILMIILVSFIKYPQKTEDGWKMFDLWQWLEKLIHIIYNICLKFTVSFDINHRIWKRTNSAMWDCYCWCTSTHFFLPATFNVLWQVYLLPSAHHKTVTRSWLEHGFLFFPHVGTIRITPSEDGTASVNLQWHLLPLRFYKPWNESKLDFFLNQVSVMVPTEHEW